MYKAKILRNPANELEVVLKIENVELAANTAIRAQLVDADKFFMPSYSGFCLVPVTAVDAQAEEKKSSLEAKLLLPQILDQCGATNLNSRVLEFSLVHGESDEFLVGDETFRNIEIKTPVVNYKLCLGKGKNIVLRLDWKIPLMGCEMTAQEDKLSVKLALEREGSLMLCRRIEYDIVQFDRKIAYKADEPMLFSIAYEDLVSHAVADKELFCLYYLKPATKKTPAFYYRVVTDEVLLKKTFGDYVVTACRIKDKTACVTVRRSVQTVRVSGMEYGQDNATFSFDGATPGALKLHRIMTRISDESKLTHDFVQKDAYVVPGNTLSLTLWDNIHQREPLTYQLYAEVDGKECRLVCGEDWEKVLKLSHQTIKVTGKDNGVFLCVTERPKKIKLGIFGTCMTRWGFSSKYTDAYQSLFDVKFAHFWPSAFSLAAEPMEYPEENYNAYPPKEQPFVRREYEKTSFRELKEAQCEYVLVDFFVDAIHGPRRMKDGKFIGYKAYANDFYQDYLMFDTEKYFLETNDYYEQWTKAADRMIESLLDIVPQNRIVLATGGLTHHFLNEEGKVECFDGMVLRNSFMTKHSINALNYLWDKMNTYFMAKLPGAHVLSMREYEFLAHDRNPANVRPYHFQDAYYRALSAELSRIVLWDRQNR